MERGQLHENARPQSQVTPLKIVVADDLPASALELLRAEGWQVDARTGRSPADLANDLADADALLVRSATKVTSELLKAAGRLRIIGRAGTGVDNIDVTAASSRGVLVVNAPGANSISVAEHALALMLALARMVPAADQAMKLGKWEKKRFLGTELRGKTLGIAGLGRIGQEVAIRARSFGMRIVAHDPFISREIAQSHGAELLTLDEVCLAADYLTLHLPSTPETRQMFNDDRFSRVKPGIRIINTARGELIDEAALARAIESGKVGGAGLDVFQKEPPVDWSLAQLAKVVATPHIAASTEEAQELVGLDTAAAVRDFLRDGVVRNAVNFPSVQPEELQRLQPWIRLADSLATIVSQMGSARIEGLSLPTTAPWLTVAPPTFWRRAPRRACSGRSCRVASRSSTRGRQRTNAGSKSSSHAAHDRAISPVSCRSSCTPATGSAGPKARSTRRIVPAWCRSKG
jgi:D-3-phosphoglycerate dehydrogenase